MMIGFYVVAVALLGLIINELLPVGSTDLPKSDWRMQKENSSTFIYKGAKINYIKSGSGDAVILLHGGGSWSYSFRNNIGPLSKHFTVYAIDIPGHGYSEIPEGYKYTLNDINGLISAFFNHESIDNAHLVGNSWGGGWAAYFAETYPERVMKTVLIDTAGLSGLDKYDKSVWKYLSIPVVNRLILRFTSRNMVEATYREQLFYDGSLVGDEVIDEIYPPLNYRKNLMAQIQYQKNFDWDQTDGLLGRLKNTVLLWGMDDKYLSTDMIERYKERISNLTVYLIDRASHLPHEERPNKVNEIIIDELS